MKTVAPLVWIMVFLQTSITPSSTDQRVVPFISSDQDSTYKSRISSLAIDRDLDTGSHTRCGPEVRWWRGWFGGKETIKEVIVYQSQLGSGRRRMKGTTVSLLDGQHVSHTSVGPSPYLVIAPSKDRPSRYPVTGK